MLVTREQWDKIIIRMKQELEAIKGTPLEPRAKFTKYSFAWDYHYTYPLGTVRLQFFWKNGEVSGYRTSHWSEGPFAYGRHVLDEKYLKKVFNHLVKEAT